MVDSDVSAKGLLGFFSQWTRDNHFFCKLEFHHILGQPGDIILALVKAL